MGLEVRYNDTHSLGNKIRKLIGKNEEIIVCPELLGGVSIPREPSWDNW